MLLGGLKNKQRGDTMGLKISEKLKGISICNIVVCCDGTWNTEDPDESNNEATTNVLRIHDLLESDTPYDNEDGKCALIHAIYVEGPGTIKGNKLTGGLLATDLDEPIKEAYRQLIKVVKVCSKEDVEPHVFLFGFSRGAYICHLLSWLLYRVGITTRLLKDVDVIVDAFLNKDGMELDKLTKDCIIEAPRICMMGLWDTVSSQHDKYRGFFNGLRSPLIDCIYHAMAADERRDLFPVMHYLHDDKITQMWFSGVHSEVGGGYADDVGLADISLEWMIDKAKSCGLKFKREFRKKNVDFYAANKKAHHPFWEKAYAVRRFWPFDRIHESVHERVAKTFYVLDFENFESDGINVSL